MSSRPFPRIERLGQYELVRRLATGGMAEVYEAKRLGPHGFSKRFALKRILPQFSSDARVVQMFCNEARLHAALSHPNLVEVVDFGEEAGALYIVMEFVEGLSCADLLSSIASRRRTVELGPALFVAREVLAGLAHAHEYCDDAGRPLALVHRDVAPNNILIERSGRVLLADFGIVRSTLFDVRTTPGEIKGKVGYISPEQALGGAVDARSDLFSLGVVIAELLLGAPLFPGRTELEILSSLHAGEIGALERAPHIPGALKSALRGALAHLPSERPRSARDLAAELDLLARQHSALIGHHEFATWLADLGLISLKSSVEAKRVEVTYPRTSEAPTLSDRPEAPTLPRLVSLPRLVPLDAFRDSGGSVTPSGLSEAGPWYRIRRPGGTIVGPLALPRLLEMIATARAGADTEVSRSGAPFLSVSSVHELARLASRPAYRFFDPVALFASERHAVDRSSLPWHLFRYVATRKTGLVCVRRGGDQVRMYLVGGVPAASASTDPEDLLGMGLSRAGLVSRELAEATLEAGYREGKPLGEALIEAGLIGPEQLWSAIAQQRARRMASLLRFRDGDLCFVDGATSGEDALAMPASPTAFVADAVRAAYPQPELEVLLSGLPPRALNCRPILHLQRSVLGLSADEAHAFDRVASGVTPVAILNQARSHGPEAESAALRALFLGLSCGAFNVPGA